MQFYKIRFADREDHSSLFPDYEIKEVINLQAFSRSEVNPTSSTIRPTIDLGSVFSSTSPSSDEKPVLQTTDSSTDKNDVKTFTADGYQNNFPTSAAYQRNLPTVDNEKENSQFYSHDYTSKEKSIKDLSVLYEESKDVFDLLPDKFLPDYKSFCWYDQLGQFQCLASVYLAGMPKCGTTDLFDKLMWHPELTLQAHKQDRRVDKEFHYWTRKRIRRPGNFLLTPRNPPPKMMFSEFLSGTGAEGVRNDKNIRIVDGTPSLLWDLDGWEERYPGLEEPPYNNAEMIHAVTPDAKIIAILRNPIDRLYSEYLYFWKTGKLSKEPRSPDTFHLDVLRETRKFDRCLASGRTLGNCCHSSEHSLRLRVVLGIYICYVREFLETFGRNFLVVTMKEYHLYPVDTLNRIFNHIGVYEPDSGELSRYIETSETVNVGSASVKDEVGEMLDETRKLLDKFYSPYNAMLSDLLNDPKFNFF